MHPAKVKKEVSDTIRELNLDLQDGLRAREVADSDHFKRLKNLVEQERKAFDAEKINTLMSSFIRSTYFKDANGNTIPERPEDVRYRMLENEVFLQGRESIIRMIDADVAAGAEAEKELEKYKKKLQK